MTELRKVGPLRSYCNGTQVQAISFYKYSNTVLSWNKSSLCLAAQENISVLALVKLRYDDSFKIFDSMITPVLTYGQKSGALVEASQWKLLK